MSCVVDLKLSQENMPYLKCWIHGDQGGCKKDINWVGDPNGKRKGRESLNFQIKKIKREQICPRVEIVNNGNEKFGDKTDLLPGISIPWLNKSTKKEKWE